MLQNFVTSRVRFFPQNTRDIWMTTMADLPSAYLMSLLVDKIGMDEELLTLETVYPFKTYTNWLYEHIGSFQDEYFIVFLENYCHSSNYAIGFLYKLFERMSQNERKQKVIIHSFKLGEEESLKIMEKYPFVQVIIRTDSEYFFYELLYKKTPIEDIPNILYRDDIGEVHLNKSEDVTYDLREYIVGGYANGVIFRKEKSVNYIASLLDPDNEQTDNHFYYFRSREKNLSMLSSALERNQMMITTGRGCKYGCTYCYRGVKYSAVRQIPLDILRKDLDALASAGIDHIYIYDDCFLTTNRDRMKEIVDLFSSYNMSYGVALRYEMCTPETLEILSRMKLHTVQIGLQTVSKWTNTLVGRNLNEKKFEEVLEVFHKRGSSPSLDLILGLPGETIYDFIRTFSYALSLSPRNITINSLFLNPGTKLYDMHQEYGIVTKRGTDFNVPTIQESTTFPSEDIQKARNYVIKAMDLYPDINFVLR